MWSTYYNGFYFYFLPPVVWIAAFLGIVLFNDGAAKKDDFSGQCG